MLSTIVLCMLIIQIILSIASSSILLKENPDKKSINFGVSLTTLLISIIWLILSALAVLDFYNIFYI